MPRITIHTADLVTVQDDDGHVRCDIFVGGTDLAGRHWGCHRTVRAKLRREKVRDGWRDRRRFQTPLASIPGTMIPIRGDLVAPDKGVPNAD